MADSVPDGSSVGDGAAKEKVNQNSCPSCGLSWAEE